MTDYTMSDDMAAAKAQFASGDYDDVLVRLQIISTLAPLETEPIAVMALCYYALGQTAHARRLWKIIISRDARYLLPRFLHKQLGWSDSVLAVAEKVNAMVV